MKPNPVLHKLGFQASDRVVIIHTDDIGMCQASVAAFTDLADFGLISSGAVMVPCPWFPAAAGFCRQNPQADMGVHLTLTSEWQHYRWRPVSTIDPASGLLDDQGFFYAARPDAQEHADPAAAQREMECQVERALAFGIRPTHIDTHMGTVAHPKFIAAYIQLAVAYRCPPMIFRLDEQGWMQAGLDAATASVAASMVDQLEEQGVPLLDTLYQVPLDTPEGRLERTQAALAALPPGLTHFIIHPSKDSPELRAITPDWQCRVADYEVFTSSQMAAFLKSSGIHVLGYRPLQELMS